MIIQQKDSHLMLLKGIHCKHNKKVHNAFIHNICATKVRSICLSKNEKATLCMTHCIGVLKAQFSFLPRSD